MLDSKFTFSIRAEQINQAKFSTVWSYSAASNLLIKELAGASAGGNVGISDSYYTDSACNADNITLDSNVTSGTFNNTAFANHSLNLLRFTNPGLPIPRIFTDTSTNLVANFNFEFHGTCKPVTMGDYVNHTSLGINYDNHFITAGFDSGQGKICINVNKIAETSTTAIVITNVGSVVSGLSGISINTNNQIRLFAHPNWSISGHRGVLLIGWDGTDIFIESYTWNGTTLTSTGINYTLGTTNQMNYTGKHDIHYLNNGNILLLTMNGANGTLFEIDGTSLNVVATKPNTNIVAYDPSFDVIGIQKIQKFVTFKSTLNSSPVTQTSIFYGNDEPFDAVYHSDEQGTMYVGEYRTTGGGVLTGHRFNYDINGNVTTNVLFDQIHATGSFTQIERTSPDVLMNSVGPNYSTVPPVRSVCDSGTYKGNPAAAINYLDSFITYYEDITQMRHPKSQDYTLSRDTSSDSTITGNNHLICSTYGLKIGCYGQNYAEKSWEINNNTGGMNAHHMYILYLGYYQDFNGIDSYGYIAVSGINSVFTYATISGAPVDGEVHWVKFRNN